MTSKGKAGLHKHPCLHFENKSVKALHWTNMKYLCHLYVLTLTLHAILALYGEQRRDGISAQFKSKSSIDFINAMFINNGITTVWVHVWSIILLSNVFFSNEMVHV